MRYTDPSSSCTHIGGYVVSIFEIVVLGLALSADAFSVTVSNGVAYPYERRSRMLLMPVLFGLFQGLMPVAGYVLGGVAARFIERYAGIITLIILSVIGGNMIREGVGELRGTESEEEIVVREGRLTIGMLLFQAVATAIDAFAVGVSLRAQEVNIVLASTLICCTTAACCVVALALGSKLGELLGERAEVVGGVVLICIGLRAFLA